MLTNLVAAVAITIVTNISEQVTGYARYVPDGCPEGRIGCAVYHTKGVDPNQKTITTNIVEITSLTFDWLGEKREFKSERVIDSKSVTIALQWIVTTNAPALPHFDNWGVWDNSNNYILLTNGTLGGTIFIRP